jgi:predicted ATPase/DNA-binding winged helix-turn-helix (wHTH) protein
MLAAASRYVYASGECEIDLDRRELLVRGVRAPIGARAFEVVELLVRSAGEVVAKDQLMDQLWPGAIVSDNALQVHISAVRKALGSQRRLVKTEAGRGYRLLGNWTVRAKATARPSIGPQRVPHTGQTPVGNLPQSPTPLVGRADAVQCLQDLVSAYRAVTLTGTGGIGKTTLALEVARRVVDDFPDGGWVMELASLSDPDLVATGVAHVLRLGLRSDAVAPAAVARAIGEKKLLLVLDNCEHLIGAVASLAEVVLALCPSTTVLSTSREILRINGEYVYRVPSLDVPAAEQTESAQILNHSAPALFVTRATEAGSDMSVNAKYISTIGTICRHLDGIPLAIEFAAARAATLGIEQVEIGLRDRFALLTGERRTALPRHRTLRATLDWSYQLLADSERAVLHYLAIFVGPFSLEAARAVAGAELPEGDIVDGVGELVGKSLVLDVGDPVTAEYRLLETTRAYAFGRLAESGAFSGVARRHARYFLRVLGNLEDDVRTMSPDQHLVTFLRRADEIHAALEWAFSADGEPTIGVALTIAAVPLWFELSRQSVARRYVEQALQHAETGSDQEMRLRIALGHSLWYLGPGTDAIGQNFTRALDIAERIGATAVQTRALWGLWAAHRGKDDYRAALVVALRYADTAARTGDRGASHLADRIVALTYHLLGHQQLAQEWTERTIVQPYHLDPASGMGYQVETPVAMRALLARILWIRGLPDQAMAAAAEAVKAAGNSGPSFALAYAITFGALPVALWSGALEEARRLLELLAAHVVGNQRMEDWRLCYGRALKLRRGSEAEALTASFIEPRADPSRPAPFANLAIEAYVPVPLPGEEPIDLPWSTPELLRLDAMLLLWHGTSGGDAAAEAKLLRALKVARAQKALSWELRAAISLAQLWRRRDRGAEAHKLLMATFRKFTEGFETSDLLQAKSLLVDLESDSPKAQLGSGTRVSSLS